MEPDNFAPQEEIPIAWMGDSHDVLRSFPAAVKCDLGYALGQVQFGQSPPDSRSLSDIGQGVFEFREADASSWYRLVYLKKTAGRIWVLHCFQKKSNQIQRRDLELIRQRLKSVKEIIAEEARDAKG